MLVTYQKRNGTIIQRTVRNHPPYRIGETTSMGWKLLDIKYFYKGKYYSQTDYDLLIDKAYKKSKKIREIKNKIIFMYKHLTYFLFVMILIRVLENLTFYNFF